MGEIADMILDGTLSEEGEYIGDENLELYGTESPGFPIPHRGWRPENSISTTGKISCGICGKKVKESGLKDHVRDVHGDWDKKNVGKLQTELTKTKALLEKAAGALEQCHWHMGDENVPADVRDEVCELCNQTLAEIREGK